MNIIAVRPFQFRSWSDPGWIEIPTGTVLLSGANGAGKTTLVDGILFALYGIGSDAGSLIQRGCDRGSFSVVVETQVGDLCVTRSIRRSGGKAVVSLKVTRDDEDLTAATVTETDAGLQQALGVSEAVLRASAFSCQHEGGAFTEAKPSERKRVLSAILPNLEMWPRLHEQAKAEQRDARAIAAAAQVRVDQLAGAEVRHGIAIDALWIAIEHRTAMAEVETEAEAEATRLAAEAESAREARRQHAAAVDAAERARADHTRATQERAAADEALGRAKGAAANAPSVEDARALAHEADLQLAEAQWQHDAAEQHERHHSEQRVEAQRELGAAIEERDRHAVEIEALKSRAVVALDGACPECGKALDQPEDEAVKLRASERLSMVGDSLAAATGRVVAWRDRLEDLEATAPPASFETLPALVTARSAAQAAQTRLAEAQTIQSLAGSIDAAQQRSRDAMDRESETAEQVRITRHAVDGTRETIDITEAPERTHNLAQETLSAARQAHREAAAELARAEAAAQQAERDAAAEAEARASLATAQRDAAIAEVLANGFGPTGVPAMVIDSVLGQMADTWNRVLRDIGSRQRIDLRSQRLTQKGDIVDALEIIVLDGVHDASYEALSGGERTRVSVAGRIALTELLAQKKGARVRVLVLDEPSHLDKEGSEQLAAVLNEFIAAGLLDRILLITHDEALSDLIDRTIRIEKVDGVSQIAGSPTPQFPSGDPAQHAEVS